MPAAAMQDGHPLEGAEELGAHCQGPALAAFVKQYFSVIQYDFMKRGYLCHAGLRLPALPFACILLPSGSLSAHNTGHHSKGVLRHCCGLLC